MSLALHEIARLVEGTLCGDGDLVIDGAEVVSRIERDSRDQGKADVFESYETRGGQTRLAKKEEDVNGDGSVDVISVYQDGKLVQRAISDEALSPL